MDDPRWIFFIITWMVIPFWEIFYIASLICSLGLLVSLGLFIENGRLSRWGRMLYRCIGHASLLSEHWIECRAECRTQIEEERLRARSACQENRATTKTVTIAPWKTKGRKGRICVIRGLSWPIRGIVYTESRVTCSRRFMKCFSKCAHVSVNAPSGRGQSATILTRVARR